MKTRQPIGRRMPQYSPVLLDFLVACKRRDDALCKQLINSNNALFTEQNYIKDFFYQYRDDLYLSEENLNLLYEKYNGVIFNESCYSFFNLSDYNEIYASTVFFGLEIVEGKLAYTTRNPAYEIIRQVKTDLDAPDLFFLKKSQLKDGNNNHYPGIRKMKQKILAIAMESGHKDPSDLKTILLFAAKRGYVTLIKRMTRHNEPLLQSLLHEMLIYRYNLACWKNIINHVFLTDTQKNKMIISCLNHLRFYTNLTPNERSNLISIYIYFVRTVPIGWNQKPGENDLLGVLCVEYRAFIKRDFDEILHSRYVELIQLLIDKDYMQNHSIVNLEFLVITLKEIGRDELANEYLAMISQVPQVKLYRAELDSDFDKFEKIADYYDGNQRVNAYLIYLDKYLHGKPERRPDFYSKWMASDLRKKILGEMKESSPAESVKKQAEEKSFAAAKSALQANHILAKPIALPHPDSGERVSHKGARRRARSMGRTTYD